MESFELILPDEIEKVDILNPANYDYHFGSFSLAQLQNEANREILNKLRNHLSDIKIWKKLTQKKSAHYVADFEKHAEEKLSSGEWRLGVHKDSGKTYAVLIDSQTKKTKQFVDLKKEYVNKLGNLPELAAIQGQLASIAEQIDDLSKQVERVEQGQYNDRYAGFFSARQLITEGLVTVNPENKRNLLIEAVKIGNETIAKLMLSINEDSKEFVNPKVSPKKAINVENHLQNSIGYLNSSVQLNVIAYTALEEKRALMVTLVNYQSFINQTLLAKNDGSDRTLAWQIDNYHKGNAGKMLETTQQITSEIDDLVQNKGKIELEDGENEQIENKDM